LFVFCSESNIDKFPNNEFLIARFYSFDDLSSALNGLCKLVEGLEKQCVQKVFVGSAAVLLDSGEGGGEVDFEPVDGVVHAGDEVVQGLLVGAGGPASGAEAEYVFGERTHVWQSLGQAHQGTAHQHAPHAHQVLARVRQLINRGVRHLWQRFPGRGRGERRGVEAAQKLNFKIGLLNII
jgi:hypothetical protein